MERLRIWTDGSYRPSIDSGGIGIVVVNEQDQVVHSYSKQFSNTTSNRMEIMAIVTALNYIRKPLRSLTIYSDSQYCLGIITKNWKRSKNIEYWETFDHALKTVKTHYCKYIKFLFTKGHSIDQFNNLADQLATTASKLDNTI